MVVANAAIQGWKPLLEMEGSDWRDVIENNLNSTANTVRACSKDGCAAQGPFHPAFLHAGRARAKDAASYSVSKWGLLALMKSAATELGPYNTTVTALR